MNKPRIIIFMMGLALAIGLTACQPVTSTPVTATLATVEATQPETPAVVLPKEAGPTLPCKPYSVPFAAVTENDWVTGPQDASVTIIEYSDFQCPYCAKLEPVMAQLIKDFPKELRLVYRHFPLISIHDKAALASQATEAAGLQGKFWEMHSLLFGKQADWSGMTVQEFKDWLTTKSGEVGLDSKKFTEDLISEQIMQKVMKAYQDAAAIGLQGTPTLFINGNFYTGGMSSDDLAATVKQYSKIKQFKECPSMTIDANKKYTATLETDKGKIVIDLFPKEAPITVNSFVFLARQGWYDGVTFHRVIPKFVAQTGDPYGSGMGNPGYVFKNEIAPGLTFGEAGVVGMANAGADSNGSQFFITYAGIPADVVSQLDGQYTIFGKVISGMDVLDKLTPRDTSENPNLPPGDKIIKVTIEEK